MTTADLYLRLSDGRNENGSFVEREKALRGKAGQLGWTVHRVVIENDVMPGGGKSATAFKRRKITLPDGTKALRVVRPGFRSVLDDLVTGRADALLAEDLDRTMRDPRDAEDLIDAIRACTGNADSLSGSLRFTNGGTDAEVMNARILVSVANKSSADTARRVAAGRERQVGAGQWGGGRRPYGFTPVAHPSGTHQNTQLVVNEVEAAEIRRAVDQVLHGVPLRSVARDLRERDVPTVTGTPWSAETLRDVLLRPLNAGILVYRGAEYARMPGDPIITEDVHRAVVAMLTDPTRSTPGRAPSRLGTGIYRCVCGSSMEIQGGRGRRQVYRCAREGGTGDVHVRRDAEALDDFVALVIVERLSEPDGLDLFRPPRPQVDVKALRRQVKALREQLDEFARDRADNLITREQMLAGTKRVSTRLAKLDATLAAATDEDTSPLAPVRAGLDAGEEVAEVWDRLSLGQRRAIIARVCTVTVLPSRRGRGFDVDAVSFEWRAS